MAIGTSLLKITGITISYHISINFRYKKWISCHNVFYTFLKDFCRWNCIFKRNGCILDVWSVYLHKSNCIAKGALSYPNTHNSCFHNYCFILPSSHQAAIESTMSR